MKIATLLPYKENYTFSKAQAAAIWVSDFYQNSKFKNNNYIFGTTSSNYFLTYNYINIKISNLKSKFTSTTKEYCNNFIKFSKNKNFDIIEIHNRPEVFNIIKPYLNSKFILYFHNDPISMSGSKTAKERLNLLINVDKIIFISKWVKDRFFINLDEKLSAKTEIVYHSVHKSKKIYKKENKITFVGKLNISKGYDIYKDAIIKILNEFKNWRAYSIGDESRQRPVINHVNHKELGFLSHKEVLSFLSTSEIAVIPSRWEEPFGRTAMEGAASGCATIISSRGGLKETFDVQKKLILKKLDTNNLFKIIDTCIKNKFFLKKIQKQNFSNVLHKAKLKISLIDTIKLSSKYKINFFNNKKIKILHIGNFNEKNSHRLFNISISNKITNGMVMNHCDVINFDYRNYFNFTKKCNEKIIEIVNNYNPQLILFGHNNLLQRPQLEYIKKIKIKTAIWFEDSLHEKGPDNKASLSLIEQNHDLIDNYFVTTSPDKIITKIPKNKINFIPVPADPNIENLEIYKYKNRYKDIFFGMSHGVNFGKLKKNIIDDRELFIKQLMYENPNISFELLGINNEQPKWGTNFFRSLSKCKMALNLSRGVPVKYYSSNRIASYTANGIATLIDIRTNYNKFFNDDEMIFYKIFV